MASHTRQIVYLITAIIGIIVTWYFNIQFMLEHGGFSLSQFIADSHANPAASSMSSDILVAVFTFLFWSYYEARRLNMRHWWLYVLLTFSIALAFALPLFMLMRERKIAASTPT